MDIVMLFPQSFISDSFEKVDFNINVHGNYKFYENFEFFLKFLKFQNSGFLDSDDNARWSRITITVVCPISDVQLKIPRELFKLPVNSSAAVNSLENYGPVNSLSVKNVKWVSLTRVVSLYETIFGGNSLLFYNIVQYLYVYKNVKQ